ncbi:MAG TPA: hypothetical protein VFU06_16735 [Longimicrobiales bacterium]|nr:hypothetical protein [Longimicrobiales bacterium]
MDRLAFRRAGDGRVESATVSFSGQTFALHRLVAGPSTDELRAYTGRYFSDEAATVYMVELRGDTLVATHHRNGDVRLRAVGDDAFAGVEIPLHLQFARDARDTVTGLHMSIVRTPRVWFERIDR